MNESRNAPWLMSVNTFDPHPPYDAPAPLVADVYPESMPNPGFRERDLEVQPRISSQIFQGQPQIPDATQEQGTANYYALIELINLKVGRLTDELERTVQRNNTIIIFMSDHGQLLGDHSLENKGC